MMDKNSKIVNLIIIRLFLKNEKYHWVDKYSTYTSTDWREYVTEKLDLFLNHCLPSITAQTDQNFDCLVLVDKTFPEYSFVQETLEANQHLFRLEYVGFPWGEGYGGRQSHVWKTFVFPLQKKINTYIRERYPKCEWLLTQRLDSDDMICNDFMENVATQFRKREEWIIFRNGYIMIPTSDGKEYNCYYMTSSMPPHLVYCEPFGTGAYTVFNTKDDIKTVYHRAHNKIGIMLQGNFPTGNANIIGCRGKKKWSKGYWIDTVGFSTNIGRYPERAKKYTGTPIREDQLEDIKKRFALCLKIVKP